MLSNKELKLHFINVNHGDATIIEFPDYGSPIKAHFGVVDFGAKLDKDQELTRDYMEALIDLRRDNDDSDFDYAIDFLCVTHPHDDHFGGLNCFMDRFANPNDDADNKTILFWDCGFRTNSIMYNRALRNISKNKKVTFIRVAAGSEFEFGETYITVLAPSVDLRNRFDTFGIGKNDSSIVLRIKYKKSYIILAADAEYASWGKTTEEFPRRERITFYKDALGLAERKETSDQLKCNLLKISHHGSKHGTSLEYLERLKPDYVVIPAGDDQWYINNVRNWVDLFPHPLVIKTLNELDRNIKILITGKEGNIIFKYSGNWNPHHRFQKRAT
jgi:beta-lactamase superfamily II metal-dependent hydrolase